jgi:predicted amidohydrolase YtcJ
MLDRVDVHCVWVSEAVIDLLPKPIQEIPGGEIVKEPGMGVFCDNAMDYVRKFWPGYTRRHEEQFVKGAMTELNRVGIVGVHDAGVIPSQIEMYKSLSKTEDWTVRVYAMLECEQRNTFCPEHARLFTTDDGSLSVRSVKLFAGLCLLIRLS